jgi:UDP-3-O-[3-hydroxymyristoyl] glucosamine N-acyltransferase
MQFTATQIAALINARIEGNPDEPVRDFARIEEGRPGTLSFVGNKKYEPYLYETAASVIIVNESLELEKPVNATLLRVADAYAAFATLLEVYARINAQEEKAGIEQPSFIHETAVLGEQVYVGAFAYIGKNVRIGNNVKIYPGVYIGDGASVGDNSILFAGVKVYHACVIGCRNIIHAGTVIGSDGFGFAPLGDGSYKKIPQTGNVVVGDDVEIGANTTIDRATLGSTIVQKGAKLDNMVQVAHNVVVGEGTVIAAQAGISGSSKIGKHCMIGGQAGIVGHIQIADGTQINGQSGVSKTVREKGTVLTGSPAFEYKSALKSQAIFRNLPALLERIEELERRLEAYGPKV